MGKHHRFELDHSECRVRMVPGLGVVECIDYHCPGCGARAALQSYQHNCPNCNRLLPKGDGDGSYEATSD
jgi:hypothetical protein